MKTAAVVCDNYKVEKFKAELIENGFADFEVYIYTSGGLKGNTNIIKVKFDEKDLKKLISIVHKINESFKDNEKENNS